MTRTRALGRNVDDLDFDPSAEQPPPAFAFIEANAHVTHVLSLSPQAARDLVVGLLGAIDIAAPADDGDAWWDRG